MVSFNLATDATMDTLPCRSHPLFTQVLQCIGLMLICDRVFNFLIVFECVRVCKKLIFECLALADPDSGAYYQKYLGRSPIDSIVGIRSVEWIQATWYKVGYYERQSDRVNTFQ